MRPHFLQTTWLVCGMFVEPGGGRGRGWGSDIITPTRQVIIPATNRAPPPMKTGRSLAQANTLPERIVSRQEPAAAAVRTGPMTAIIIPRMKMSDLKFSQATGKHFLPDDLESQRGLF